MELTYYGHSTFAIKVAGKNLLFDPFISPNPKAEKIVVEDIHADYILLSHGHQDHMADAIPIAKKSDSTVISNYEIVSWFGEQGITKGYPLNHGGKASFEFGQVKYVNAVHSSVLPDGTYGGNPGGFIIYTDEGTFYFAGDTALTMDMQLIPRFAKLDFAILPIGDNFTMGYEDAVIAADFIQCNKILGVHYDTFPYIEIEHAKAKEAFKAAGKELIIMEIGETRNF
jgi:L-ascorbate metabolism protein UlaG (beta-lactamase superfamily)